VRHPPAPTHRLRAHFLLGALSALALRGPGNSAGEDPPKVARGGRGRRSFEFPFPFAGTQSSRLTSAPTVEGRASGATAAEGLPTASWSKYHPGE